MPDDLVEDEQSGTTPTDIEGAAAPADEADEPTAPEADEAAEDPDFRAPVVHEDGSVSPSPASQPIHAVATDAQGVDRIVAPYHDPTWTPAPISATDEQKAHAEEVLAREEEARQERLALLNQQNPTTGPDQVEG